MKKSPETVKDRSMEELDDEAPINPIYKEYKNKMASDMNRLLKSIYRLSEVITKAIMTEGYFDSILSANSRTSRKLIERSFSAWSKLDTIRAISRNPIEHANYLSPDDLLDELRTYACSTDEALMYVVVDSSLGGLLIDDLPKQLVYSCTDFFEIIESLLREDVAALEGLLSKIVPWTDEPTPHRKPGRSVLKSARGSMLE
jgi:hypothetical protein